jgi:lipoic acid synthetase
MLGLGEEAPEVSQLMADLSAIPVNILTIGQYLQPTPSHLPVHAYVTPAEFAQLAESGHSMGFDHVESGPFVRSSYHAWDHAGRVLTPNE